MWGKKGCLRQCRGFLSPRWCDLVPSPLSSGGHFFFKDEEFDSAYRTEQKRGRLYEFFAVISIIIAWLTSAYQSLKASLANPADIMRHE
jgi:hypothetical protein